MDIASIKHATALLLEVPAPPVALPVAVEHAPKEEGFALRSSSKKLPSSTQSISIEPPSQVNLGGHCIGSCLLPLPACLPACLINKKKTETTKHVHVHGKSKSKQKSKHVHVHGKREDKKDKKNYFVLYKPTGF
jgi:hypothetical protein